MIVHARPRAIRYRGARTGARQGRGRGTIGAPARRPDRGGDWPEQPALAAGTDAGGAPARAGSWKDPKL